MEISKADFIKEVKNTADYFNQEEEVQKFPNIHEILEEFWSVYPKKGTEEYFREGSLRGKTQTHRTVDDAIKFIIKNYTFILKKILHDNQISITDKQNKLFDILDNISQVIISDSFENVDEKKSIPEHVLAYLLGCYTTQYQKINND
jgi:hypothetical protein